MLQKSLKAQISSTLKNEGKYFMCFHALSDINRKQSVKLSSFMPMHKCLCQKTLTCCYCFHRFTPHKYYKANSYEKFVGQILICVRMMTSLECLNSWKLFYCRFHEAFFLLCDVTIMINCKRRFAC